MPTGSYYCWLSGSSCDGKAPALTHRRRWWRNQGRMLKYNQCDEVFQYSRQHSPTPETALITHPRRSLADMAWEVEENGKRWCNWQSTGWRSNTSPLSLSLLSIQEMKTWLCSWMGIYKWIRCIVWGQCIHPQGSHCTFAPRAPHDWHLGCWIDGLVSWISSMRFSEIIGYRRKGSNIWMFMNTVSLQPIGWYFDAFSYDEGTGAHMQGVYVCNWQYLVTFG